MVTFSLRIPYTFYLVYIIALGTRGIWPNNARTAHSAIYNLAYDRADSHRARASLEQKSDLALLVCVCFFSVAVARGLGEHTNSFVIAFIELRRSRTTRACERATHVRVVVCINNAKCRVHAHGRWLSICVRCGGGHRAYICNIYRGYSTHVVEQREPFKCLKAARHDYYAVTHIYVYDVSDLHRARTCIIWSRARVSTTGYKRYTNARIWQRVIYFGQENILSRVGCTTY